MKVFSTYIDARIFQEEAAMKFASMMKCNYEEF